MREKASSNSCFQHRVINRSLPVNALREGCWFKLICGASYQHLPAIRSLVIVYALAGADCIDVAADPAVIAVAREALTTAQQYHKAACERGFPGVGQPWLMVSFNAGEDPHFRKAVFDPAYCPPTCPRPCETICPTAAIDFNPARWLGVSADRCFGCGRCLTICPNNQISAIHYQANPAALLEAGSSQAITQLSPVPTPPIAAQADTLRSALNRTGSQNLPVDAVEIHTQVGQLATFTELWHQLQPWVGQLRGLAISCPNGPGLASYLRSLLALIGPLPCPLIWQTDGRPMSGDIGGGATETTISLAEKVLALKLPGYVQLAGGTNDQTVARLARRGLLRSPPSGQGANSQSIAGIAYGSYARSRLMPLLEMLDALEIRQLETVPHLLWHGVELANGLVSQLKAPLTVR